MKKIIAFVLISIFTLSLVGCGEHADSGKRADSGEQMNDVMKNKWGITLEAQNVTPSAMTIVCHQSGGENVSELYTGSFYVIQRLEEAGWVDVEYIPQEYDVIWTAEGWGIQKENTTTWGVNWEWLYGKLPAGEYRIGKEIMNFRGTGDYDKEIVYVDFTI